MSSRKSEGSDSTLPGYCLATLGEVVEERVPQVGPAGDFIYLDIGSVDRESKIFIGLKKLTQNEAPSRARQAVRAGDVLVSMTRPNLNAIAMVPELDDEAIASTGFQVLRSDWVEQKFIYYLVQSDGFIDAMTAVVQGALYPAVRPGDISGFQFNLPPRKEQTRIVEKLEELLSDLDAGVAELKAAQRKLAQYRQSLLKAAVEGVLTADWRHARAQSGEPQETGAELLQRILTERRTRWETKQLAKFAEQGKALPKGWQSKYSESCAPDTTDLPPLSEGWVWTNLDQLTEFVTSGSRGWANYYADRGATFIRSQNINKDWLDLSDTAFVDPPWNSEGARTRVQRDDLLLTITGANVGKSALVNIDLEEAYVSQHVALIRPVEPDISAYLHLFLTCKAGGRGQLDNEAYGAGKPGLNLQQILSVVVPLPNPHELPELLSAIALAVDAAATQEVSIAHALQQSAAQRKNILKAAFAGQLVPQDPNDEPASALLERIRAERVSGGAKRSGKNGRKSKEQA